jgi:hypothetical protein
MKNYTANIKILQKNIESQDHRIQIHNVVFNGDCLSMQVSYIVALGGLAVIVLAIGPKPGRGRWIFKGDRNA